MFRARGERRHYMRQRGLLRKASSTKRIIQFYLSGEGIRSWFLERQREVVSPQGNASWRKKRIPSLPTCSPGAGHLACNARGDADREHPNPRGPHAEQAPSFQGSQHLLMNRLALGKKSAWWQVVTCEAPGSPMLPLGCKARRF